MDDMFRLLWEKYRTWADTSARLKTRNTAWKRKVLILTIGGTMLATLGSVAGGRVGRALPMLGAAALALATYFGKELLDSAHEEQWTRARAAAEAFKSEAHRYLVQAMPYDGPDRVSRLKARLIEVSQVTKDQVPDDISPERAAKGMPTMWWTLEDYLTKRLQDQIDWYRSKAREHASSMARGRAISLTLGGFAVALSAAAGAAAEGAPLAAGALGVVTTAGGSVGAYFQAGHFEAIAVKYRETAGALAALQAELTTAPTAQSQGEIVAAAEAIMQAEHAAWLTGLTAKGGGSGRG
jgi:hypothetical protein